MMVTPHAAVGVVLTTPLLFVAPELAPVAALAGFAGGVAAPYTLLRKRLPPYFERIV